MNAHAPALVPQRNLCTDCGLSRTHEPKRCASACQFIQPDYPGMEQAVHGRVRHSEGDERFFGPHQAMWQAWLTPAQANAQWSGITTSVAEALLQEGWVDAVITVQADPEDKWRPRPVVITRAQDMAACRGMRMGYAPLLAEIEPALDAGLKRLAVIGIPCQVYPLRQLEAQWRRDKQLEALYVIGTPCSDNTTTENFHHFLSLLSPKPQDIDYLEFRSDYRVEVREAGGKVRFIPFLNLPISQLPSDFFPLTCRTCVDYTNSLSDLTIGYMGGHGEQWVIVRNARGQQMLDLLGSRLSLKPPHDAGSRRTAVKGFLANTERAAGGLPVRRTPVWLRPLVNWLMPRIGPRGLEFARARVEMKAIETVVHLQRHRPARMAHMVPPHVWSLAQDHGLHPQQETACR